MRLRMKSFIIIICFVLILTYTSQLVWANDKMFVMKTKTTVKIVIESSDGNSTGTVKSSQPIVRTSYGELYLTRHAIATRSQQGSMAIVLVPSYNAWLCNPTTKRCMYLSQELMTNMLNTSGVDTSILASYQDVVNYIHPINQERTIAGYTAEGYSLDVKAFYSAHPELSNPGIEEEILWFTKSPELLKLYSQLRDASEEFNKKFLAQFNIETPIANTLASITENLTAKYGACIGTTLTYRGGNIGASEVISDFELVSLEIVPYDDTPFSIPEGYQVIK